MSDPIETYVRADIESIVTNRLMDLCSDLAKLASEHRPRFAVERVIVDILSIKTEVSIECSPAEYAVRQVVQERAIAKLRRVAQDVVEAAFG